ncbi:MAG: hypothetical protein DIKNOCCD_01953 [bacterium]|nr:hypothetical protein [bacterium]
MIGISPARGAGYLYVVIVLFRGGKSETSIFPQARCIVGSGKRNSLDPRSEQPDDRIKRGTIAFCKDLDFINIITVCLKKVDILIIGDIDDIRNIQLPIMIFIAQAGGDIEGIVRLDFQNNRVTLGIHNPSGSIGDLTVGNVSDQFHIDLMGCKPGCHRNHRGFGDRVEIGIVEKLRFDISD